MRSMIVTAALAAGLAAAVTGAAAEPFKNYDRFGDRILSPARWAEGERVRLIKGGQLNLMQRTWGLTDSDSGLMYMNWVSDFEIPFTITQMRARVTVNALETVPCPSNPAIGDARARIVGGFFNVATPTPGSQVNDVIAQVRAFRASNSADAAGVLRVQGIVSLCTSTDCSATTIVGNIVDLGTVSLGTPVTLELQWDQPGKTFRFSRDNGASTGTVAYAFSDSSPPSALFRQLSTRVNVPSCRSAPPVSALVDAAFDNVQVNQSASP